MADPKDQLPKAYYDDNTSTLNGDMDELKKILTNTLWNPEDPDRVETVDIPVTEDQFRAYLADIANNQYLGEDSDPIKKFLLTHTKIVDSETIGAIYLLSGEENYESLQPVTIFFLEANKSAVSIIPIPLGKDKLKVKVIPLIDSCLPQNDTLRAIYLLWKAKRTDLDFKARNRKDIEALIKENPKLKRGFN